MGKCKHCGDDLMPDHYYCTDCEEKVLKMRVSELEECLKALLNSRPCGLECQDFHHSLKDRHHGFGCPCLSRWNSALESALNALSGKEGI